MKEASDNASTVFSVAGYVVQRIEDEHFQPEDMNILIICPFMRAGGNNLGHISVFSEPFSVAILERKTSTKYSLSDWLCCVKTKREAPMK